jgi:hypothetical protein
VSCPARHAPIPVDVAAAGALAVVAAEVAADGTVVAGWVAVALDAAAGKVSTLVVDPLDVVPGVHPASAAVIARNETTAASPKRAPDPDPMA